MNDIEIATFNNWKYVDDTTMSEFVDKGEMSYIQHEVDEFTAQAQTHKLQFNEGKCKELRIGFSFNPTQFDPILINNNPVDVVDYAKILGLTVSNNLKWNKHVDEVIKKARMRLYFLSQLKKSNIATKELLQFYTTCIQGRIYYVADAAYAAGLALIGASRFTVTRPLPPRTRPLSIKTRSFLSASRIWGPRANVWTSHI